ncbi:glycoside hydrolase family 32 protein [Streptomyces sp.]|uniref:glycoside hydrolase family 32 protein n=1 Tax=Streptomyces sp. TaxID=1931 RepID=UPI002F4132DD
MHLPPDHVLPGHTAGGHPGIGPAEPYRPQLHYTPERNWMNDPNGLVWHEGEYHLFYQYNPEGNDWGNISWGHAVSRDLVHWDELAVAIPATEDEHIFSGCAVVDEHNTSGFGESALVAVYTAWHPESRIQAQSLAYSTDRGRTWTKYEGNPVLDIGSTEFRDPKVFWYEPGGYWVMAVVHALEWKITFYRSDDLKQWTRLSDFGPANATGGIWEVPDIFELPVDGDPERKKWVLAVSLNPGGVAGGSGAQYFIGDFDGVTFTADNLTSDPERYSWVDYGRDFYAAVSWNNAPGGERIWIGWMNNWADATHAPTTPWRGAQSLPRTLALRTVGDEIRLVQQPVEAVETLRRGPASTLRDHEVEPGRATLPVRGGALEIAAEFELGTAERFGLVVRGGTAGEGTLLGYDTTSGELFVDRSGSGATGSSPDFPGRHGGPLPAVGGRVRFTAYVDWSSVEVFGDRGQTVITDLIFPGAASQDLGLFAEGGTVTLRSLEVWPLA